MKIANAKTFGNEPYATTSDVASAITSHSTNVGHVPSGGTAGQVLTKTTDGQEWADVQSSSYTLPIATDATLGGIKVGDNLTITEDGTLSADVQDAVEHLSTLPESWSMQDNGRVFVWEADSTESLSKGHIYKVNTTETAPGILIQLTPKESASEDLVNKANLASGLYTPYDTIEGSDGKTVRAYTRYKNPNGCWLVPSLSNGYFANQWLLTTNPAGTLSDSLDHTGMSTSAFGADKTSLTAADIQPGQWDPASLIPRMQSQSITDVAGGVSADFEDLTPVTNAYTKTETDNLLNAKADKATTLAGYGITDAYTKTEVDAKVSSVYRYRGTVSTYAGLPVSDQQIGDVYNIETADAEHGIKAGDNVAWNGTAWDVLAGEIDLSAYATKSELSTVATTGNYNDLTNKPDLTTKLDAPATAGTVGQVLTKTESGQVWADAKQYTLTPATKTTLGGVKIGDNLTITEDGTLSADVQDNVVEHLSTLPESWSMQDNGRVFVWESASTESLSKGHIYKVNTTETPSGISLQLTPSDTTASTAEKVKGLYVPTDTLTVNLSNGSTRIYTRYKNQNGYWIAPYVHNGANSVTWMITTDPSGDPNKTAVDTTGSIDVLKTSLTATDLSSAIWFKSFMNQSSPVFTDIAGGVSTDFEDLTPESTVDIPIASASTLGGVKIGDNIEVAEDGTISAVVPQLEEDVTSWEVNTVPGAVEFFALRSTVAKADNDIVIDWGDGTSTVLKTAEVLEYTDGSASTDGVHYVDNPDHKVTCYTGEWEADGELAFGFEHVYQTTNTAAKIVIKGSNYFGISRAINYNNWRGSLKAFLTDHHSLMSRCLAEDLPVAKCVNNLSWFAAFTDKLSKVHMPTGWDLDRIENWYGCFMYSGIQEAQGFSYKLSYAKNCAELFSHCSQLKSCDFKFPCVLKYASTCNATFWGCINLEGDIASFFPKAGLAVSRKAEFINTFNSCAKLTGTVPAKQLWENANVEWTNTYNAFASCSDAIRAQVPVEWGGTMVRAYKDTYKGQLKREQTTVEVTGQNQQLTLDAGQTACLVITGAGTCSLVLSNWEDGDSCEVVVNTSQVTLQIDGSWVTNDLDITTNPGLYVLELAQYEGSVFCKVKYPDTGDGSSTSYTLPVASSSTLGGIKVGSRLTIDSNGVLSADEQSSSYTLPAATDTTLGGVKVGSRLSIDANGVLSADEQSSSYTLPVASETTLGGVKQTTGATNPLRINGSGVASVNLDSQQFVTGTDMLSLIIPGDGELEINPALPGIRVKTASTTQKGVVKVGSGLSIDSNGVLSADAQSSSYTLPAATAETLGGVKIGANLSIAPDGTLSANATGGTPSAPSNAVEHLSTLPESWTMGDGGKVFVWEADSTESLSKGHIYKVNTTETASGILIQLTPPAGFPEDFATFANQVSGLYTPYDTVEGSSGGTVRAYTRYKNPNNYWLTPYISGGNFTNMWMITNNPSGNTDTATDYTGASISADKTSLTAADLTSATWGKNFMNSMQSKSFTDVVGGVSADFEDLTPESAVDIPIASTSTLGGIKVGSRLSIDANGVLSADEQSSSYTLPVASTSTLGGVKVNNSTGALKVAQDGLLALLVSSPEAMKNGETGIAVNLKTNGGLMFQTVTYGDPTKALGMSPKATYNQLSGSSVMITPSVQPYKLTASDAVTLNSSYSFGINDGVVSTGDIAYAEIVIVLGASGSITAGMDLTLVDALTEGKTNYCVVRWEAEKAKLFVWRVE